MRIACSEALVSRVRSRLQDAAQTNKCSRARVGVAPTNAVLTRWGWVGRADIGFHAMLYQCISNAKPQGYIHGMVARNCDSVRVCPWIDLVMMAMANFIECGRDWESRVLVQWKLKRLIYFGLVP